MHTLYSIHRWDGSPKKDWQPWLKRTLENIGFNVVVPAMPNSNEPTLDVWLPHLQKTIKDPKGAYFVGHSLGCATILRYLETLPKGQKIKAVILVAGFSDNIGFNEINSFFETEFNWEKIRSKSEHFVAIFSDNDPYVPLKHADIFKENLSAKIIVKKERSHFNENTLPEALFEILNLSIYPCETQSQKPKN